MDLFWIGVNYAGRLLLLIATNCYLSACQNRQQFNDLIWLDIIFRVPHSQACRWTYPDKLLLWSAGFKTPHFGALHNSKTRHSGEHRKTTGFQRKLLRSFLGDGKSADFSHSPWIDASGEFLLFGLFHPLIPCGLKKYFFLFQTFRGKNLCAWG